ncbi:MAG: hypothetical protein NT031_13235, partial [Planctomycetota bacterium]|nr:hypothetical protein [Planctomycetota bacterium]
MQGQQRRRTKVGTEPTRAISVTAGLLAAVVALAATSGEGRLWAQTPGLASRPTSRPAEPPPPVAAQQPSAGGQGSWLDEVVVTADR